MTLLGIPEATLAELVRGLTRSHLDAERLEGFSIDERAARAIWTALAEPGDRIAVEVCAALGHASALRALTGERDGVERAASPEAGASAAGDASSGPLVRLHQALLAAAGEVPDALEQAVDRWTPRLDQRTALLALRQAVRFDVALVVPGDPCWPAGADDLGPHAPHALWVRGGVQHLSACVGGVALVGARAATGYGEHVTVEAASGLVDRGHAIVSGAAYGIDGAAHRAALASQGTTIAVLAGGLDRYYPSGHDALLTRIAEHGAVVSEVPCGVAPTKWRFLQRNRLIAALSSATVIVEAGWRSGSLNTANHALTLGRPLGAVPGPVTSSASAGCHRLLRDGYAMCVTNAEEMAELTGAAPRAVVASARDGSGAPATSAAGVGAGPRLPAATRAADRSDPDGARLRLLDAMSRRSPRTPQVIAAASGLGLDRVRAELGALELDGVVQPRREGWVIVA